MGNRTKNAARVNEKVMIVAIDIGKEKNTAYCRYKNGCDSKPFEFSNTHEGFKLFWEQVAKTKMVFNADKIIAGFESTGCYGEPLMHYLLKKPVILVQVNPMHTKRVKELADNSPNKTDRKDPQVIADIIQLGHYLSLVVPTGAAAELRQLTHFRESIMDDRIAMINQLQALVGKIFPEFLMVMKEIKSKSALYLLEHYPFPEDIVRYGVKRLAKKLRTISRGRLGNERAQELVAMARNSVGIKEGRQSIRMRIQYTVQKIREYDTCIDEIEDQMKQYLHRIACSSSLMSIKGIKHVTVAGIIGEVGNFNDFHNGDALEKLAGLDLYEISSGKHKGQKRISKRGRSLLRKILYFASINVVKKGCIMHDYYQRLINGGKPKIKALIAVSRKLLRIMFALVRDKAVCRTNQLAQRAA